MVVQPKSNSANDLENLSNEGSNFVENSANMKIVRKIFFQIFSQNSILVFQFQEIRVSIERIEGPQEAQHPVDEQQRGFIGTSKRKFAIFLQ